MPLSAGTRLGPYEVLAPIGAGGMGEVYRARDTKLDRDVAIKVLPAALAQDPERLARFEREAKVLAALNHPNIAQIYGVEESGGVRALVMELVPGEPLKGPLPLETALNYAKQIADALEAAHEKGIVHRDLKPANIMITPAGVVKVLDFGLAAVPGQGDSGADPSISPTLTVSPTRAGMILGTAAYMGPEQARGQAVDRRADIWAFGVVLYEMLTGRQAFAGETITDVLAAVVTKEPEWDGVPVKVRRLLQSCLQKNPKQRLQAIGDWRLLIEDAPQTAPQVAPPRYRWMIVLAAAICVLVGAAMFFVGRRTSRTPSPSFQRVTFRRGTIDNGRFANGGKTIAYSASWDGNPYRVYSTQAENPESRDLGIVNAHLLGVSPSDEMALAIAGTLARVPISGGTPRQVADDIAWADWASDGQRLAVVRSKPGYQQLEFPIGNVLYQTTGGIGSPRISPKRDLIGFLDFPFGNGGSYGPGSVATVDLKGNKKTLTDFWLGFVSGLEWSPSSDEMLFTAAPYGQTTSLYAVNRSGRQRLIAHLSGEFTLLDIAPDGRLLMSQTVQSNALSYLPNVGSKETDLYWHDLSIVSDISRDGKSILFAEAGDATRGGEDSETYLRGTDGSPALRLGPGYPLEISPDGKWAMVLGSTRAPAQLVLLPTGTGEPRPLTHDGIHHQGAAWTPDGKRIVFVGNEPGHRIRYYVQNLDGGTPRAITPENVSYSGFDPVTISPDGRSVAVAGLDGKIALYPLDDGALRTVPKVADGFTPLRWCQVNSLMVYHAGDVPIKILRADVETGEQTPWKELAPANRTGLGSIPAIRVRANCQSSAYSAFYNLSELWIADGLR
jgi:Tol biopolymer transport system component